jgi:hypothetical protein
MCGCNNKKAFQKSLNHLIDEGKILETQNGLSNYRVEKEVNVAISKSDKARAAAFKRWEGKSCKNNEGVDAFAHCEHMPRQYQPESEPDKMMDTNVSKFPNARTVSDHSDEIHLAADAYNEAADQSNWPKVTIPLSKARTSALQARLRECDGLEGWKVALEKTQASRHCCGGNERGWTANFDFLTKQSSFAKLMEGNYDNRSSSNSGHQSGGYKRGSCNPDGLLEGFSSVANRE